MLSEEIVSLPHFFSLGIRLFILCGVLLFIFNSYFLDSVLNTKEYKKHTCTISSIGINYLDVNCQMDYDYEQIKIVKNPCILAKIDADIYKSITFYRNYDEKTRALSIGKNVSRFREYICLFFKVFVKLFHFSVRIQQ